MLDKVEALFERQLAAWPMLSQGTERLKAVRTRDVLVNEYRVEVRHLPHRIASTTAAVDGRQRSIDAMPPTPAVIIANESLLVTRLTPK